VAPRFYITTAIDYANGDPHLGHAYEKIGADVIARYRRLRGDDVYFLMGMDEHGQKVAQTAAERGVTPQQLADTVADRFQAMWRRLDISNDRFIRTTEPGHKAGVLALIERIATRSPDDLYEHAYEGLYCVGCELFKRDSEIVDGKCAIHPTRTLELARERNWFFRLTRYRDFLRHLFDTNPNFLAPESRRNEVLALLDQGLDDISVTRARLTWGIPFPKALSTGERQVTWVWFDALPNYLTATGFPAPGYETRWPAQLHVIGKDITRLHCVIWPAMLQSAGLPLPERVWAHGFAYFHGERFSKSAGVTLDLDEAIDRHGPDAFRFFLMREIPWDADGSFTWERFDARYEAELANGYGNLASRVLAMIARYTAGITPSAPGPELLDRDGGEIIVSYREAMDQLRLHDGAAQVSSLVSRANQFVQETAPWTLAKAGDTARLAAVLAALARGLARITVLASPFMPQKAQLVWEALGLAGPVTQAAWRDLEQPGVAGRTVTKPESLFPKAESAA
jgi:methionyl-tRNA synthetase